MARVANSSAGNLVQSLAKSPIFLINKCSKIFLLQFKLVIYLNEYKFASKSGWIWVNCNICPISTIFTRFLWDSLRKKVQLHAFSCIIWSAIFVTIYVLLNLDTKDICIPHTKLYVYSLNTFQRSTVELVLLSSITVARKISHDCN